MIKKSVLLFLLTSSNDLLFGMDPNHDLVRQEPRRMAEAQEQEIASILWNACQAGDLEVARQLICQMPNITMHLYPPCVPSAFAGRTFLHAATGSPDIMQLLLNKGAKANAVDVEGFTPINQAMISLQPKTVALLLAHGALPGVVSESRRNSPLHTLVQEVREVPLAPSSIVRICEIIHMLRTYKDVYRSVPNRWKDSPLHYGAARNDPNKIVSLLLPSNSDQLKIDARARFFTFLSVNHRHAHTSDGLPELSREVVLQIFLHMPIECRYAEIDCLKTDISLFTKEVISLTLQEKIALIRRSLIRNAVCRKLFLVKALSAKNDAGRIPQQLATDSTVQQLLDPITWQ